MKYAVIRERNKSIRENQDETTRQQSRHSSIRTRTAFDQH